MAFFGSMQQQQSLGVGEFIAILRLVSWMMKMAWHSIA
jgi:hypothetical protein